MWLKSLYWLISNSYYTGNIPILVIMVNTINIYSIYMGSQRQVETINNVWIQGLAYVYLILAVGLSFSMHMNDGQCYKLVELSDSIMFYDKLTTDKD